MEFDVSKVYTAVNAEQVPVGSKVFVADTFAELREQVELGVELTRLLGAEPDTKLYRFRTQYACTALAYLAEEPESLKWTDLKVGDIIAKGEMTAMVTQLDMSGTANRHIYAGVWIEDKELKEWRKVND